MLGLAAVCWVIWKTRNAVCFGKKIFRNPLEILCSACAYMRYWACLYPELAKEVIEEGVDVMLKTTIKLVGRKKARTSGRILMIEDMKPQNIEDKTLTGISKIVWEPWKLIHVILFFSFAVVFSITLDVMASRPGKRKGA
jgi:hypothetical protein